jgi:hypothetical protein
MLKITNTSKQDQKLGNLSKVLSSGQSVTFTAKQLATYGEGWLSKINVLAAAGKLKLETLEDTSRPKTVVKKIKSKVVDDSKEPSTEENKDEQSI